MLYCRGTVSGVNLFLAAGRLQAVCRFTLCCRILQGFSDAPVFQKAMATDSSPQSFALIVGNVCHFQLSAYLLQNCRQWPQDDTFFRSAHYPELCKQHHCYSVHTPHPRIIPILACTDLVYDARGCNLFFFFCSHTLSRNLWDKSLVCYL